VSWCKDEHIPATYRQDALFGHGRPPFAEFNSTPVALVGPGATNDDPENSGIEGA